MLRNYGSSERLHYCVSEGPSHPLGGHRLTLKTSRFRPTSSSQSLIILALGAKLWLKPERLRLLEEGLVTAASLTNNYTVREAPCLAAVPDNFGPN